MAAVSTLLELSSLKWNQHFSYMQQLHRRSVLVCSKHRLRSNFVRLQIACNYKQSSSDAIVRSDTTRVEIWRNSFDQIAVRINKALDSMKKPAIAAVLLGLLLFYETSCALAASGGRIGGSSFSSWSESSSSSSSSPSSSSSWSSPSSSSSFSSDIWSSSSSGKSRTSDTWTSSVSSSTMSPVPQTLDPGCSLILVGAVASVLVCAFRSNRSQDDKLTDTGKTSVLKPDVTSTEITSVLKLQVGLLGSGRTLQQDFNSLAESADTSTSEGLSYVLTEATLALLRYPDYCISSYSSVDVKQTIEEGEERFNQVSIEERAKFDEETLVNVNSMKRQSSKIRTASGFDNEYIVVTILVAAEGVHKLQPINRSADLKEALQKLGSIPTSKIMAVEVLWTPQDEKDTLSERELLEDYPLLKPLS